MPSDPPARKILESWWRNCKCAKAAKMQAAHQYGQGYSPKTINNQIAVLHRLFEKAIEYAIIEKNPVTKRSWFRRDRTAEDSREFKLWRRRVLPTGCCAEVSPGLVGFLVAEAPMAGRRFM